MSERSGPLRVVVAGTAFGRVYLDAVLSDPDFSLAGILARGSEFSQERADRHGVPLYTSVDAVPGDVDLACVVVSSGALGGPGSALAQEFLRRGIHVVQEHPVHAEEIADCLRAARAGGAAYAVNTLYPRLRPVRQFLAAARALRLDFVDAACNSQVAYPLLDILGRLAGGLRPWRFGEVAKGAGPFQSLHAEIGGLPVTLRVQNQVHPDDPDNHSYLLHRIMAGGEAGVLALADTHGPVLWSPRLHAPRDPTGRLIITGSAAPSTVMLGDPPGTHRDVFAALWPDAVARSLHSLRRDIADPARRMRSGQWALGVSLAWRDLTAQLGLPELIEPPEPRAIPIEELTTKVGEV
ncbi:Gfo/Idh/MocA family oxidoreductase [Nonomuraea sp. B19D2]|uniref:Gfo/Idh/MocA family oxidoreductase n=1 Tax=Nonomuraea sp. B19D2 TaxID=3159561 RepID=UPI0032DB9D84